MVKKPTNAVDNSRVSAMWARDIRRVARSGDWILTRSYSAVGDLVTASTAGEDVSHAALYDAESGTVIEAITPRVREVPLEHLLDRNRYAIVVRPSGLTAQDRAESVARARSAVGSEFDYLGMFGIDSEEKYYCSELVVWAGQVDERPLVVAPSDLVDMGEVIYFSGVRDDAAMQKAAHAADSLHAAQQPGLQAPGAR